MKKYSFRLENVRRVRRLQEEAAKATLATANRQVQLAQELIDNALLDYSEASSGEAVNGNAMDFMQHRYMVELAGRKVVEARGRKAEAEQVVVAAHRQWAETAQRVKALDRLDERAREEYRIEFERDLEAQADDINVGRHSRPVTA